MRRKVREHIGRALSSSTSSHIPVTSSRLGGDVLKSILRDPEDTIVGRATLPACVKSPTTALKLDTVPFSFSFPLSCPFSSFSLPFSFYLPFSFSLPISFSPPGIGLFVLATCVVAGVPWVQPPWPLPSFLAFASPPFLVLHLPFVFPPPYGASSPPFRPSPLLSSPPRLHSPLQFGV